MRVSRSLATVGAAALVTVGAIASPAAADDGASGFTIDDNYVGRYAPSQNVAVSGVGCNPVGNSRSAITWGLYSQDGTAIEDAAGAEAANSDGTWSATIDIPSIVAKNGFDNPAVLTLGVACVDYNGQITGTQQMPLILDSTDVDGDVHISSWDTDGDGTFDSQTFTANLTGFTPGESVNFYITDEDGNTVKDLYEVTAGAQGDVAYDAPAVTDLPDGMYHFYVVGSTYGEHFFSEAIEVKDGWWQVQDGKLPSDPNNPAPADPGAADPGAAAPATGDPGAAAPAAPKSGLAKTGTSLGFAIAAAGLLTAGGVLMARRRA